MTYSLAAPNEEFFFENRKSIKRQHKELLMFIYDWVSSENHPICIRFGRYNYYLVNYDYLAHRMGTKYNNIRNWMKRLSGLDEKSDKHFLHKRVMKNREGKNLAWIAIDKKLAKQALSEDSFAYKFICCKKKAREKIVNEMLFEVEDARNEYPEEAVAIANLVLDRYSKYFRCRKPKANEEPTKSYIACLRKITDIYNGCFTNPHIYTMSENFNDNIQFDSHDWRKRVDEMKGSWSKVKALILNNLGNFELMHESDYMPFSKENLATDLSTWLYDDWLKQSQFAQCVFKPEQIVRKLGDIKSKKIFDRLPSEVRKAGNRFFDMNEDVGQAGLWEGMEAMYLWAKEIWKHDSAMRYWVGWYDRIPMEFYRYCKERDLEITTSTFDMRRAVKFNTPWRWFVAENVKKYGIRREVIRAWTPEQIVDIYEGRKRDA